MFLLRHESANGRILAGLLEEIETEEKAIAICEKMRKQYAKAGIKLKEIYICEIEGEAA